MYCFNDRGLEEWFDLTREEIIKISLLKALQHNSTSRY